MSYLSALFLLSVMLLSAAVNGQRSLAIIGSSTSACYGASGYDSCYVGRLNQYYNQAPPSDTGIDNGFAVPGYSCYRGMPSSYVAPYADPNLQPDPNHNITKALSFNPNVVLVNYPTNSYDSLPVANIMFCLRTIRDSANKAGVPCFITTTQPRTSGVFNNSAAKLKLTVLKDSILAEFGSFAIDFYTGLYNPADSSILYDAGDQTHMNNTGHDSLARRVIRANVFLSTLPATFLQFNTVYKNNSSIITWLTSRETDVVYYEVQRSADGTAFFKAGTVNASNTSGNNQYRFTDNQALQGWTYYRIVIVDKDGQKHASPVMKVYAGTGKLSIVRAFARTASQVVVELQNNEPQNMELQVLNSMGVLISKTSRKMEAGTSTLNLDTPVLSTGVYYLKLTAGATSIVRSFIKN